MREDGEYSDIDFVEISEIFATQDSFFSMCRHHMTENSAQVGEVGTSCEGTCGHMV